MDDGVDAGGILERSALKRVRVNGRRMLVDLTSGRISKGPPALVGKYICGDQIADICESDSYGGRLFLADTPGDVRLAAAEYRFIRSKERCVGYTPITPGIFVEYGGHGRFKVIGEGECSDSVLLEDGSGRRVVVPRHRYLRETHIVAEMPLRKEPSKLERSDPYSQMQGEGHVQIEDAEIDRIVSERAMQLLTDEGFISKLVDELSKRIAHTTSNLGQEPADSLNDSGATGE